MADADRGADFGARQHHRLGQRLQHPRRQRLHVGPVAFHRLQDGELVAAEPRHRAAPRPAQQAPGELAQQRVARRVAEAVVDLPEPVDVEAVDGDAVVAAARGLGQRGVELLGEERLG